jgi:hypothetical protein
MSRGLFYETAAAAADALLVKLHCLDNSCKQEALSLSSSLFLSLSLSLFLSLFLSLSLGRRESILFKKADKEI